VNIQEVRSFAALSEIPYFMDHHRRRLKAVEEVVLVVSNRNHLRPSFVHFNAFHRHLTAYAAIDALAEPLAEFFAKMEILPIVDPIPSKFKNRLEELAPKLHCIFSDRGILIPREVRQ
jgi:hypothetical protein